MDPPAEGSAGGVKDGAGASDNVDLADAIVNVKSVSGGAGGDGVGDSPGGHGGMGIDAEGHDVINRGFVDGGAGGRGGGEGGDGGDGGTAIDSGVGDPMESGERGTVNHGTVMGGRGGSGGAGAEGGAGGVAVHQRTKGVVNYGTIIGGAGGRGGEGGGAGGPGGTGIKWSGSEGIVNHGNILSSGTGIHVYGHTTGGIVINGAVIAGLGEGEEMLQNLCQLKHKDKSAVSDALIEDVAQKIGIDFASACPEPD